MFSHGFIGLKVEAQIYKINPAKASCILIARIDLICVNLDPRINYTEL